MHKVYLFQPQYAVEFRKEKNYWIPYSSGCLWAYCDQFDDIKKSFVLEDIIFRRENHDSLLERLQQPSICGFSCYQWNRAYCLALAEKIKKKFPNCIIVFGGPEVTVDFGLESFIDCVVLGEGEAAWLEILRNVRDNVPIKQFYPKSRLDVTHFPSPYTTGVFDRLISNNPGVKWATTLETNRGCPFSCTFCDWGSVTYSKVKKFGLERVADDLDWISKNPITYIFCADANFGILKERDLEIAKLVAEYGRQSDHLEVFNATFNKNNNEWSFEILKVLGDLNKGFTVSVQSLHKPTLKAIKRDNLGINDLRHIFDLCDQNNVGSYSELILGLPLETKESFIDGICELLELGQHSQIEVWFVDLLTNSELASPMDRFNYGIKSIKTANYLALLNQSEDELYPEEVELVCATKTMTTEEMIDCYLYSWMIVNFHLQGYSQLTSRYARKNHDITYREFYDRLFLEIEQHPSFSQVYRNIKTRVATLLYQGKLDKEYSAHNLLFTESEVIHENKHHVFEIVDRVFCAITGATNQPLHKAQKHMILDLDATYPITLDLDFDLHTFAPASRTYSINKKFDVEMDQEGSFRAKFYALRRKGLIKTIQKIVGNH